VSHAPRLIEELSRQPGCNSIRLEKEFGETIVAGDAPAVKWQWPAR
jgi:predicted ATPase